MGAALLEGGAPACDTQAAPASGIDPAASGVVAGGTLAAAVVLFGFTGWAYLITWGRTLAFFLGGTLESRALTGAVFLMGMALGAFLAAGVADRLRRPLVVLVALLSLSSVVAYASMHLTPMAMMVYMRSMPLLHRPALAYLPPLLTAASLMLPSCLLLGAALPFLPLAVKARRRPVAGTLPLLAAGVAAAELTLRLAVIPVFGLRRALALAAAVGLLSAILFVGAAPFKVPALRTTIALVLLGLMVVLGGRPAPWVPHVIASGPYRYAPLGVERHGSLDAFLRARHDAEMVFYREGRDAAITVERTFRASPGLPAAESLAVRLDGSVLATTGDDLRARVLLGQLPLLIHGPAERVLLTGFVDGVTAGSVLRHPVKSLTIIEREPALFEAAAAFADYNHRPLDDQRVRRVADAARARLLVDHAGYDVILLDGLEPWRPEGAALLTSEGLGLVKSRLRQGGVAALRVALSSAPEPVLRTILSTFASVFRQVLLFQASGDDLVVLGSSDPLTLDVGWMRNVIGSSSHVAQDLHRVVVLGPNEILLAFRLTGDGLRRVVGEAAADDDSRGAVEFASARQMMVHGNERLAGAIDAAWEGIAPILKNYGRLPQEKAEFLYNLAKSYLGIAGDPKRARGIAQELMGLGRPAMARWVIGESLFQEADIDGAVGEWGAVLEVDPSNLDALFSLGTYYLDSRDYWKADGYLERAARLHATTPVVRYHHGRNLFYLGRHREAINELRAARQRSDQIDSYPLADYLIGVAAHRLGREAEAAESLKTYLKWAYGQNALTRLEVDAHLKLAEVYDKQGKRFDAHKERQKGEELRQKILAFSAAQQRSSGPSATAADGGVPPPDGEAAAGTPGSAPATPGRGPATPGTGPATPPAPSQP
jgi:tetratricopeptide (TPR) repeat protein